MTLLSNIGVSVRVSLSGPASQGLSQADQLKAQQAADAEQATQDEKQADTKSSSSLVMIDLSALRQSLTYRPANSVAAPSSSPMSSILQKLGNIPSAGSQRKNAARARLNRLKSQIEAMKKAAIALNPRAAKAMAAVLKMLAAQLKSAAADLAGSDGGGPSAGGGMSIQFNSSSGASAAPSATGSADAGSSSANAAAQAQASADTSSSGDHGDQPASEDSSSSADTASAVQAQASADTSAPATPDTQNGSADTTTGTAGSPDAKSTAADQSGASDKTDANAAAQDAQQLAQTAAQAANTASKPGGSANFKIPGSGSNGGNMSASDKALVEEVARSLQQLVALVKMHLRGKNKDIQGAESAIKDAVKLAEGGSTGAATLNVAVGNLGGDAGSASGSNAT
ncbi:hypothetical protein HNQ50_000443 [Silvimonas terrae]|uniref:Uncharacterized protein n=1 Tax=Silvimonas terrae TaxID=300266 RepID=A0A840RBE7_9NEIS|nr:hypothetical protein [Silvimonas terrae]MBB5189733.1 hypothetical protein [Silvimonas terrae]